MPSQKDIWAVTRPCRSCVCDATGTEWLRMSDYMWQLVPHATRARSSIGNHGHPWRSIKRAYPEIGCIWTCLVLFVSQSQEIGMSSWSWISSQGLEYHWQCTLTRGGISKAICLQLSVTFWRQQKHGQLLIGPVQMVQEVAPLDDSTTPRPYLVEGRQTTLCMCAVRYPSLDPVRLFTLVIWTGNGPLDLATSQESISLWNHWSQIIRENGRKQQPESKSEVKCISRLHYTLPWKLWVLESVNLWTIWKMCTLCGAFEMLSPHTPQEFRKSYSVYTEFPQQNSDDNICSTCWKCLDINQRNYKSYL